MQDLSSSWDVGLFALLLNPPNLTQNHTSETSSKDPNQIVLTVYDFIQSWDTTSISLTAGCDLFIRYVTRTSALEYEEFNTAKSRLN